MPTVNANRIKPYKSPKHKFRLFGDQHASHTGLAPAQALLIDIEDTTTARSRLFQHDGSRQPLRRSSLRRRPPPLAAPRRFERRATRVRLARPLL